MPIVPGSKSWHLARKYGALSLCSSTLATPIKTNAHRKEPFEKFFYGFRKAIIKNTCIPHACTAPSKVPKLKMLGV